VNMSPDFFFMMSWLIYVYEVAIQAAAVKSHLSVRILKYKLILLYKEYYQDYARAAPLTVEVGERIRTMIEVCVC
jgi:hypothetical protein